MNMLEYARNITNLKRFFYFSTDEVFGPADTTEAYKEWDRHNPTNPYAASKSAGEMICLSYANSYKLPLCITRTMNNFGERQHPEKFIPKVIKSILNNETVIIHSDSTKTRAGSRFYIHCRNVSSAILFLLDKATQRECYHIIGERELDNLEMAKMISKIIGRELNYEMIDFHSSRPGHDMRYSLDGTRLKDMGWQPPKNFEESLAKTINWYLDNKEWLNW
jgi:dTDP-glucose 4,6-dehydratase